MEIRSARSLPARIVAMSFIVLILLGNAWFVLTIIGQSVPGWIRTASHLAVAGVLIGGALLTTLIARERWRRKVG